MNPQEFKEFLNSISSFQPKKLVRADSEFNFKDIEWIFDEISEYAIKLSKPVGERFLSTYPISRRDHLRNCLANVENALRQISEFNPVSIPDPGSTRQDLANNLAQIYEDFYDRLIIPFNVFSPRKLNTEAKQLYDEVQSKLKESEKVLQTQKEVVAEIGTVEFASIFESQAKEHGFAYSVWIGIGIIFGVVTVAFSICLYIDSQNMIKGMPSLDLDYVLAQLITKSVVLTLPYIILFQIIKNINNNRHLYIINKHKANSIKTFEAFKSASEDGDTKDFILRAVASACFSSPETGFVMTKDNIENHTIQNPISFGDIGKEVK